MWSWRSPFPFPAKNLTQTGLIRKWIKRFKEQQRSFCQPKPLFFSRNRVAVGRISCKDCSQPHLPSECSDRTQASCRSFRTPAPPFTSKTHSKEECLWGRTATAWRRGCYISAEKEAACSPGMSASHNWTGKQSISAVFEPQYNLGSFTTATVASRLTSIFTIRKMTQHLVLEFTSLVIIHGMW